MERAPGLSVGRSEGQGLSGQALEMVSVCLVTAPHYRASLPLPTVN